MPNSTLSIPTAQGRLPGIGHLGVFLLNPIEFIESLRKYGDMAKIYLGPTPSIVLNSPALIRRVLVTEHSSFKRGKAFKKMSQTIGQGIVVSDDPLHKNQRRMLQPAFQHGKMDRYVDIMRVHAEQWVGTWQSGQTLCLESALRPLTMHILANSLVRSEFARDTIDKLVPDVNEVFNIARQRLIIPDWIQRLPTKGNKRFKETTQNLRDLAKKIINTYKTTPDDYNDLLSMLIAAQDPATNENLTCEELMDQLINLISVGSEFVVAAIAWFFYEIFKYPEIEQRLLLEIDTAGGSVTAENISNLNYIRRTIQEMLRLYSPTFMIIRRSICKMDFGQGPIPADTNFLISPYTVHHDPKLFSDPLRFDPERWECSDEKRLRDAFIPFGNGPHLCMGIHYAMTEICVVIATVIRRWKLIPIHSRLRRPVLKGAVFPPRVPMRIESRTVS
jgi:cytochrome P450